MNKTQRCLLHMRCIIRKWLQHRDYSWHWQHLLRELGCGVYSGAVKETDHDTQCYT